jgi:hypothetical protein
MSVEDYTRIYQMLECKRLRKLDCWHIAYNMFERELSEVIPFLQEQEGRMTPCQMDTFWRKARDEFNCKEDELIPFLKRLELHYGAKKESLEEMSSITPPVDINIVLDMKNEQVMSSITPPNDINEVFDMKKEIKIINSELDAEEEILRILNEKAKEITRRTAEIYCRGENRMADFNPWEDMESINVTKKIETSMKGDPVPRKDLKNGSKYIIKSTKDLIPIFLIGTFKKSPGNYDLYHDVISVKIDGYERVARLAKSFVERNVTFYNF